MYARGVFTTIAFKKLTPQSLFLITIFLFITTLSFAIPRFALAQGPPDQKVNERALDNFPFAFEHVASEVEVPGELVVKFRKDTGRHKREEALSRVASKMRHFEDRNTGKGNRRGPAIFDQLVHVKLNPGITPEEAIANLKQDPHVEYVEHNLFVHALETFPNDPDFNLLWGLYNTGQSNGAAGADIDVVSAWDTSTGSSEVVVAVIDTGIEYTHPDLAANMWVNAAEIPHNGIDDDGNGFVDDVHGYDFYNDDADPIDDHFHGTHCAGTIGAKGNNGIGVTGVNWTVRLMAIKFLSASGNGDTAGAVSAIQYAINNGAHVMSNSWGGSGRSQALQDVILEAHNAGIVFVAAAGNNGNDSIVYPAAYEKVIAVSATDHNDEKASFSSYGTFIDVGAPGVYIYSTKLDGSYGYASGTSMACPHVAGLAALIKSQDTTLTPDQVEYILETSADDLGDTGWDTFYGSGRINASWALQTVVQQETFFPTAGISSPAQSQIVSGPALDILGTVSGTGFVDYTVKYAAAGEATWNLITTATTPVSNGLLASWDTSALPDGDYLIKLTVTDTLGRNITDVVGVTVDGYETIISFPTQLVSQGNIDIVGSAETKNDIPFESYLLEWGTGSAPTSFSTTGITMVNNGQQSVNSGKLASWDTTGLVDGQTYTLRLTVRSTLGGQSQASVKITADIDLVQGWPIVLSAEANPYIIPTVADLDGDGIQEIITAGPDEQIRVYRKDARPFPGFPVAQNEGDYFRWAVNVDDLDGDGTREIIAVASNRTTTPSSRILILKHDGTPFPGWPMPGLDRGVSSSDLTPAVADLNGDGVKELVTIEVYTWVDRTGVTLHAFSLNGTELTGFPKLLTLPPVGFEPDELYPSKHGVPSIADLDQDGRPEIAWSYSNRIYLFDHEGNVLPGWPFIAPDYNGKIMVFENAAASGDIDGDGQLEVFSIGRGQNCGGCQTQLYGWTKNGSILPGLPKTDQGDEIVLWNTTSNQNTPALVDIDGDDRDEVLVGLNNLIVFDENGKVPFATGSMGSHTQPSPSDVDGDGLLEFSANWYNTISVMDDDGSSFWWRIMPGGGTRNTPGLFADLDGDGTMELVLVHADRAPSIALYVWEIPRSGASPAREEWRMFNHDPARSGRQDFTLIDPPEDNVPPISTIDAPADGSTVSGITTVVISASDNVGVARVELYADDVLIATDNSEPYTIAWDTTTVSNGSHTLLAMAYDAAGNERPSLPMTVMVSNDTTAPDPPALVAPADGAVSGKATPTFQWSAVSDPSGVRYRLQVDNHADFSSPEIDANDLESTSYTPAQALSDGTYSWRVSATDGTGNAGSWSEFRTLSVDTQPCLPVAPVVSLSPASQDAPAGTALNYAVSITNSDSENCASSNFVLSLTLPSGWTGTVSPNSLALLPGQTGQAALSVSSADNAASGSYGVSVTVSDVSGSEHRGSGSAGYTVLESAGDSEPPSAPTGLSANLKLKHVNLSWNAARDNVGVAGYQIWCNGALIGETTVNSYVDRSISLGETYTYHVVAFDAAGNVSGPSNSLTLDFVSKTNQGKGKGKPK
jgi:subtilisin family serine protease